MPVGEVLLDLVDFVRDYYTDDGVLLPVDNALLQRGEDLAPVHGYGIRAEGSHDIDINRRHDPDLEALHVIRVRYGFDIVGELTEPVLAPRQSDHVVLLQGVQDHLARRRSGHGVNGFVTGEHEGERKGVAFGDDRGDVYRGVEHEVYRTAGDHLGLAHLVAADELGVGIDLDVHLAAGVILDQLGELNPSLAPGCIGGDVHGELVLALECRLGRVNACQPENQNQRQYSCQQFPHLHVLSGEPGQFTSFTGFLSPGRGNHPFAILAIPPPARYGSPPRFTRWISP